MNQDFKNALDKTFCAAAKPENIPNELGAIPNDIVESILQFVRSYNGEQEEQTQDFGRRLISDICKMGEKIIKAYQNLPEMADPDFRDLDSEYYDDSISYNNNLIDISQQYLRQIIPLMDLSSKGFYTTRSTRIQSRREFVSLRHEVKEHLIPVYTSLQHFKPFERRHHRRLFY